MDKHTPYSLWIQTKTWPAILDSSGGKTPRFQPKQEQILKVLRAKRNKPVDRKA
jgi:hypothetical protein